MAYTEKDQRRAFQWYLQLGGNISAVSRETGISKPTLYNWKRNGLGSDGKDWKTELSRIADVSDDTTIKQLKRLSTKLHRIELALKIEGIDPVGECPTDDASVYVIKAGSYVKIGITSASIDNRVQTIQTYCPIPITDRFEMPCKDNREVEKRVHQKLSDYSTTGEWFKMPFIEAVDAVKRVAKQNYLIEHT